MLVTCFLDLFHDVSVSVNRALFLLIYSNDSNIKQITYSWDITIFTYPAWSDPPLCRPISNVWCGTSRTCDATICMRALRAKRQWWTWAASRTMSRRCSGPEWRASFAPVRSTASRPLAAYHIPPRFWVLCPRRAADSARWSDPRGTPWGRAPDAFRWWLRLDRWCQCWTVRENAKCRCEIGFMHLRDCLHSST